MALSIPTRRGFLAGFGALLAAPAVVRASMLMPISTLKLPKLKYITVSGAEVGTVIELAGSSPAWVLPLDGRLIRAVEYPDLCTAVRGRPALYDDEYLHLWNEDGHPDNTVQTIDYWNATRIDALLDEEGLPL